MITITILGPPLPWKAPYVGSHGAFSPRYNEIKIFRLMVSEQYHGEVMECAVCVDMRFFMPIPKATSKKKRALMISGKIRPISRADRDNLAKLASDCLNGIVIKDDSQIVEGDVSKWYGEEPRTEIDIQKIE
jgi:Holliday junction resolvase RusA-like endonuclease